MVAGAEGCGEGGDVRGVGGKVGTPIRTFPHQGGRAAPPPLDARLRGQDGMGVGMAGVFASGRPEMLRRRMVLKAKVYDRLLSMTTAPQPRHAWMPVATGMTLRQAQGKLPTPPPDCHAPIVSGLAMTEAGRSGLVCRGFGFFTSRCSSE